MGSTDQGTAVGIQSYAHSSAVALGVAAVTTAPNQFVCGGNDYADSLMTYTRAIYNVWFGSGVQRNNTIGVGVPYTIHGSGAYGANYAGGNITIAGGKGTGAGTPGSIIFSTALPSSPDSILQTLSEKARIVGSSGNVLINTISDLGNKLDVNGTTAIRDTLKMPNIITKSDTAGYKPLVVDASGNVFKMNGWPAGVTRKSTTVTGVSYTVPADIDVVFVNYAAGQATITLPTGTIDREITIKNLSTAHTVIISGLDTNESNSVATRGAITVKYSGSAWVGISKY